MRRHKAVARIFLFLSIVSFAFAGFAPQRTPPMHEMRVDLVTAVEDATVTEAPERGHAQSGELPELLGRPSTAGHLQSRIDIIPAASFSNHASIDLDDLESKKFFNKELNRKLKEYFILGTIAGIVTGVANGVQKQYLGTVAPGASTIGRRAIEPLDKLPRDQEDPVSRLLSNMGDEDLKTLSVLSRRMLNSLDQASGS